MVRYCLCIRYIQLYPAIIQANLKQTVPHMKEMAPYHFIDQLNKREEHAFRIMFDQFYPSIVSYALKFVQDINLAQEICSDSFVKFYRSGEIFEKIDNVKAYLFTITRHGCLDAIKRIKYHTQVQKQVLQVLEADDRNFITQQEIQSELVELLYLFIEKLPKQCRLVFRMHISGMKPDEIAATLHLSTSTVRNQIFRGVKLLRKALIESGLPVSAATISIVLLDLLKSK